jgi:mannose-6-phosphate isomerase-like protein (cupin superfamily)
MTIQTKAKAPKARLATSTKDWTDQLAAYAQVTTPYTFDISTPLLTKGRTNMPLAGTDQMSVVLKVYAEGGENEVHAHPNEDHIFLILQGEAQFYGPNGELAVVGKNQGIMLPAGSLYRFHANGDENLVFVRVGAKVGNGDPMDRIDAQGAPFDGSSEANKHVDPVFDGDKWFR